MKPLSKNKSVNGTSFHQQTVTATLAELEKAFGPSTGGDGEKTNHEWEFETEQGDPFTIYDWKQGSFGKRDTIDWHIGAHTEEASIRAARQVLARL